MTSGAKLQNKIEDQDKHAYELQSFGLLFKSTLGKLKAMSVY